MMLGIALAELCLELKLKSEDKDFNDYFVETETYLQALDKLEKLEVKPSEASNYFLKIY